ncbi:hypothetical protein PROFUN_15748, partial [Planoprotostelium fungivorum]
MKVEVKAEVKEEQVKEKLVLKTTFENQSIIQNVFTGGRISLANQIMSCCCDTVINIMDIKTSSLRMTIPAEDKVIITASLDRTGKYLVASTSDLRLWYWSLGPSSFQNIRKWKGHESPVITMCFDHSSGLIVSGSSSEGNIRIWDAEAGHLTHDFRGHQGPILCLAFHPDPKNLILFSGSEDHSIRMWFLQNGTSSVLQHHMGAVISLEMMQDKMISTGRDRLVTVWNQIGKAPKVEKNIPVFELVDRALPLNSKEIIVGGEKGILSVWNIQTGKKERTQSEEAKTSYITNLAISTHTKEIITTTVDHDIYVYQTKNLKKDRVIAGYNDQVVDVKYVTMGSEEHLAVANNSSSLRIFPLSTNGTSSNVCTSLVGHEDIIMGMDVIQHPKLGNVIATASKDKTARLWNADSGTLLGTCTGHLDTVTAVIMMRKRSPTALFTASNDRTIKHWRITEGSNEKVNAKIEALGTVGSHDMDVNSFAISPNDKIIASASQDKTVKLWNALDMKEMGVLKGHHRGVWSVAFSPIEQCCITGSGDRYIKLWNINDFTCIKTLEGHVDSILKVSFVTNGQQILSAGSDGIIKLWNVRTNECAATLEGHTDRIWTLAVNKNDKEFISAGGDSIIKKWTDVTAQVVERDTRGKEQLILKQQELENLVRGKQFKK